MYFLIYNTVQEGRQKQSDSTPGSTEQVSEAKEGP
jgi:hypothetical protein